MSILMCIYNVYLIFSVKTAVNQMQSQTTRSVMYSLTKIQMARVMYILKNINLQRRNVMYSLRKIQMARVMYSLTKIQMTRVMYILKNLNLHRSMMYSLKKKHLIHMTIKAKMTGVMSVKKVL